jgi:hypothetical protein
MIRKSKRVESKFRVRLSRHLGADDGGGWHLTVVDKPSGISVLDVAFGGTDLTFHDEPVEISSTKAFSDLMASSEAHCEGTLFASSVHGLTVEVKRHTVELPEKVAEYGSRDKEWDAFMDELAKRFEAEGWELDRQRQWNPHNREGENGYRITVRRWVDPSKGIEVVCQECGEHTFIETTEEWTLSGPTACHCGGQRRKAKP